jgi:hypothetical protein
VDVEVNVTVSSVSGAAGSKKKVAVGPGSSRTVTATVFEATAPCSSVTRSTTS